MYTHTEDVPMYLPFEYASDPSYLRQRVFQLHMYIYVYHRLFGRLLGSWLHRREGPVIVCLAQVPGQQSRSRAPAKALTKRGLGGDGRPERRGNFFHPHEQHLERSRASCWRIVGFFTCSNHGADLEAIRAVS